jgi:phosphopantothenoylcysteine synthetase/decarboxylase
MNQQSIPHCVITAGPTYESLDEVRRLTNFSTGSLGAQLSDCLRSQGAHVTLLTGYYCTYEDGFNADTRIKFTTTSDLAEKLKSLSNQNIDAIFHAAAVSDFAFGKVWKKSEKGEMAEIHSGKVSTRSGSLLAELVPTPKILPELRSWFPNAFIAGWKYEVEGSAEQTTRKAEKQLSDCNTDLCVLNGPAIGSGFKVFSKNQEDPILMPNRKKLFTYLQEALEAFTKE